MASESTTRVLVADGQEIVRLGVTAFFADTEFKVVAEAATGRAAAKRALEREIDAVLLEVQLPDEDGLTAAPGRIRIDKPDLPVLMFSASDNRANIAKAVALGANGFISKGCTREELLQTLRTVRMGESVWSAEQLHSVGVALRTRRTVASLEVFLSEREAEVLRHIAFGLTNNQIAKTMMISYDTVKEHVQHLLRKIGLTDRTQAAVWAVRNNLV